MLVKGATDNQFITQWEDTYLSGDGGACLQVVWKQAYLF